MSTETQTQTQTQLIRSYLRPRALANVDETGIDPAEDVRRLLHHEITEADLLAECLNGADDDRVLGWRQYVETLEMIVLTMILLRQDEET